MTETSKVEMWLNELKKGDEVFVCFRNKYSGRVSQCVSGLVKNVTAKKRDITVVSSFGTQVFQGEDGILKGRSSQYFIKRK